MVAQRLQEAGFAPVLADLLTPAEDEAESMRFDIDLLGTRLSAIVDWIGTQGNLMRLPLGLFGASTGAAAALKAAAGRPDRVRTVVSRGGRPDLAGADLRHVTVPVLLIVGGHDEPVIELNREAAAVLGPLCQIEIVPGATHLFSEPGALETVATLAAAWFERAVGPSAATGPQESRG